MGDTIRLWEIKDGSEEASEVKAGKQLESEERLEELLAVNPEMLMRGLWLVGRQTPIGGGNLDLLGVDGNGQLVVFELKRGTLTRDAVAQVIDYGSALEAMGDQDLAALIADHSGQGGIARIEDFEDSLIQRGYALEAVRPARMTLVGLGADDNAMRMVGFLRGLGVDIALLTYHAYEHDGSLLLARRADEQLASEAPAPPKKREPSTADRRADLLSIAETMGISDLWDAAVEALKHPGTSEIPTAKGINYQGRPLEMEGLYTLSSQSGRQSVKAALTSHSVRLVEPGSIKVSFYPVAVELCLDEFTAQHNLFERAPSNSAPRTERVEDVWFCVLSRERWEGEEGAAVVRLADAVNAQWLEGLRSSQ